MDKGGRQIEGRIHNPGRSIRTYSDVFWAYKLLSNISNNDEQDSLGLDHH